MSHSNAIGLIACLAMLLVLAPASLHAETPETADASPAVGKIIEEYCVAISDQAAERRIARQAQALKELGARVENRIARLEQATTELEAVIKRQEDLRRLADTELVSIYSGMAPDMAASQMEKIGTSLASSVLRQLKPRQAGAILNEMKPDVAAQLVKAISSSPPNGKDRN
jgi:flagellar motility protein MotE (MotC chaperone)